MTDHRASSCAWFRGSNRYTRDGCHVSCETESPGVPGRPSLRGCQLAPVPSASSRDCADSLLTPSLIIAISSLWLDLKLEIFFDILSSFAVDSAHIFSCHLVSMSDDSSKPASGAVSLCRAFAAQCSWGSFPRARHGCVPESVGVACHWPADRSHDSGSQAFRSDADPPVSAP